MYYDDESVKSLPSDRKELLDGLMKEAISFFESALKVERSEGTRISAYVGEFNCRTCEGSNYINDLGKVLCERDCVPNCGKLKIPPEHNIFLYLYFYDFFQPCSCLSIACPTDFKPYEGVLEDADFALFVSVSNDESCRPQVYTHSEYCGRDLKTNRPVGGHIGICPDAFKSMLPRQRVKWLSTIKREIVRMLVFAPYHLKKFPTAKLPPK
ncbi:unnamed protein product [Haemonchus placei]|uniref:Uncharacterized protein n=1 Tax=Haemonchus placei TaxID=6290 RepID=A0A0N4VUW7_HAEPC|nr:unnamed protein product [Haemonchus placei]